MKIIVAEDIAWPGNWLATTEDYDGAEDSRGPNSWVGLGLTPDAAVEDFLWRFDEPPEDVTVEIDGPVICHYQCEACPNEFSDRKPKAGPAYCPCCDRECQPYSVEAIR